MSRSLLRSLVLASFVAAGCGAGQIDTIGEPGVEGDDQATTDYDRTAEAATVGGKAKVTASALNLRSGPSTSYGIVTVMPSGAIVDVLAAQNGWYKVNYNGKVGWCSGYYLTPYSSGGGGGGGGGGSAVDAIMNRAKTVVGFSYKWGGGCWDPGSSQKGACYGSCPNCSHKGTWGADCSGFVAKAWQVPGPSALTTCSHPYSTANFVTNGAHWNPVNRGNTRRADAMVYNQNGAGHIFLFSSGDAWGWMNSYECKGCSYGCVYNSRTAGSMYKTIRREGL